ncbi:hypothetical protein SSCHL_0990 [Staphylococcus schleiferi]|nr:hypothetical protein SSCHL_0990 [Staphylococcus schleiferi]
MQLHHLLLYLNSYLINDSQIYYDFSMLKSSFLLFNPYIEIYTF